MSTIKGINCKVEVALTFGAAKLFTSVSKAYPPVGTLTAHGITNGEVGYWTIGSGMVELADQAIMANNIASGTIEMPGLDTTNYSTFVSAAGNFLTMASTWGTIAEAAGYQVGGGAGAQLNDTRLTDTKTRNIAGLLAPQDITIDVKNGDVSSAAMAFIERKAQNNEPVLIKISHGTRVLRVAYGTPSLPGENVSSGELASGQFSIIVPAFALKPNV